VPLSTFIFTKIEVPVKLAHSLDLEQHQRFHR
jgi:hypothetical protein